MVPVQRGLHLQGEADSQIVLACLELAAQFGKGASDLNGCLVRVHFEMQEESLDPRVSVLAVVVIGSGDAPSVVEGCLCPLELPGFDECGAQARIEPPKGRVFAWE